MLSYATIISFTFGYLALLFAIAWFSEKSAASGKHLSRNPYIYALSLAVYCTAWTYYGSVGRAATNGLEFLTIYIGPSIIAPLWWIILRKIIRICKVQRISSIADFISSRYGKSVALGSFVALFCLLGIIPYIALQIKAIAFSVDILHQSALSPSISNVAFYQDSAFYISLGLAFFTVLFGTRNIESTAHHEGMVMAVAFESLFKLLAFVMVGVFVTYFVFDGFGDIVAQATTKGLEHLYTLQGEHSTAEWFWMSLLSMMAILFLPRQFQMGVIENNNENHLNTAMWLFPLYLLVINIFVMPIALGGLTFFPEGAVNSDAFVLVFPMVFDKDWLAIIVYLGGFSAATSMIIVSTISLSTMTSNSLLMPLLIYSENFQKRIQHKLTTILLWARRVTIFIIILMAYAYYKYFSANFSLVSIGLISFVAIAQFTPAIIGGIFWKKGSINGAFIGMMAGFIIWFFTLVVPTLIATGFLPESWMTEGIGGIYALRPQALLGYEKMSVITHGLFFSLSTNLFLYLSISLFAKQNSNEHNQAIVFVDIFKLSENVDNSIIWKGQAYLPDLKGLLNNFLGPIQTQQMILEYGKETGNEIHNENIADSEFINYSERVLAGIIGSASARLMMASVVKEEEIKIEEVLDIVNESRELKDLNLKLKAKRKELKKAYESLAKMNETLRLNDLLKDEFISTVTHEMKTPLTSIKAFSEILMDEGLAHEDKKRFLDIISNEIERMTRLIDQVLDLERFDSGKQQLNLEENALKVLLMDVAESMQQVFKDKSLTFEVALDFEEFNIIFDTDRIQQVLLNLLSNASKFAKSKVILKGELRNSEILICVSDDGKGIDQEELPYIFDKFFQAKNQSLKKPIGSGLGLAISKKIIDHHGGELKVFQEKGMTQFTFSLPLKSSVVTNKT